MPFLYEYKCNHCQEKFEVIKPIPERLSHDCPRCGQPSPLIPSVSHDHWGWNYTEASHHEGNQDEIVSNRPSNDWLIKA